jgi:hypothetical protein
MQKGIALVEQVVSIIVLAFGLTVNRHLDVCPVANNFQLIPIVFVLIDAVGTSIFKVFTIPIHKSVKPIPRLATAIGIIIGIYV